MLSIRKATTNHERGETTNEGPQQPKKKPEKKRKVAYRGARHRLLSIHRDCDSLQERVRLALRAASFPANSDSWPWVANQQCGSWYLNPSVNSSCYFKSTDGHIGTYAFSLKRLNLSLLQQVMQQHDEHGGCFLVDSSARKLLPDSFSRTIPIWACVMNRIVERYRLEPIAEVAGPLASVWDTNLYTPASIVSPSEHLEISNLIDSHVELVYRSKVIVDPKGLVELLTKPVRPVWVANGRMQGETVTDIGCNYLESIENYFVIVCCNPSFYAVGIDGNILKSQWQVIQVNDDGENHEYYYTPGAADDHEAWARGLTAEMFWNHTAQILDLLAFTDDDEADKIIDALVHENRRHTGICPELEDAALSLLNNMNMIGAINLSIGSRRSGRPPDCWRQFDAILNVTDNEYPIMSESIVRNDAQFYLNLPVAEGKRDKTELERFMPLGLVFVIHHLQQGRCVLVHCNQGKDRSVAMVLALVVLVCPLEYPLQLRQDFEKWELGSLHSTASKSNDEDDECDERHLHSGLSKGIIDVLLSETGKESFLAWVHEQMKVSTHTPLVDKERLRIALHLVKQDRENADPSRSTMQKLNRFFMSSAMYREIPLKEFSC